MSCYWGKESGERKTKGHNIFFYKCVLSYRHAVVNHIENKYILNSAYVSDIIIECGNSKKCALVKNLCMYCKGRGDSNFIWLNIYPYAHPQFTKLLLTSKGWGGECRPGLLRL